MKEVELAGVSCAFGEVQAVDDATLSVPAGAITALLGPSGCGKTTLLRLVAGFARPETGVVRIGGQVVASAKGAAAGDGNGPVWVPPERRRVGMVFQQLALFPHLTVAANVVYGLGRRHRDARSRASELLELVGLRGYDRRWPDELSGGQAQRVALARALAPRPAVVLLDEPFSSLDVSLRAELRREVRDILRAEGVTAVLVTHDQDEALALGDRVAVMLGGRIVQSGSPEVVYRHPGTPELAEFLGDANLLKGHVRGGVLDSEIGPLPVDLPDGPAQGLVRPEDLDVVEAADGSGRVLDVEYYGHDQLVTVSLLTGVVLRARLHARRRLTPGQAVAVGVSRQLVTVAWPESSPCPAAAGQVGSVPPGLRSR